jgi:hypothetical protein
MSSFAIIKVEFGSQLRRLAFNSDSSSWAAVRSQILTSYDVAAIEWAQCALHYLDDEGDLISVNSDTEFAEAMRCAKQKGKILKLILSKSEKTVSALSNTSKAEQHVEEENKADLLKVAVDGPSDASEIDIEDVADDDAGEQQVEEMDLPLSRRDLLSKSPTLSEASDSSFVSINAQSLRDDLDGKDEQAVEGVNDSQVLLLLSHLRSLSLLLPIVRWCGMSSNSWLQTPFNSNLLPQKLHQSVAKRTKSKCLNLRLSRRHKQARKKSTFKLTMLGLVLPLLLRPFQ